ncbi:MAG: hypothetical protein D6731_13580 [Planctomycetota bacterium]|nr:MAG: hypothetical protein D6731_13580 [Planctomycetota bacterium]
MPKSDGLEAARALAREALREAAVDEAFAALPAAWRSLLADGAGGDEAACATLLEHTAEAWVAERLVQRVAGAQRAKALGPGDPADRLRRRLPPSTRRSLARRIDARLPASAPDPATLWPASGTARTRKRRGGVYTERPLVRCLLDLVGWQGEGSLLEPAVGDGAFLGEALRRGLAAGKQPEELAARLAGVDVHPFACRAARTALALTLPPEAALPEVVCADALAGPPEAPSEAEGRWDFVVGNPPFVRGERLPAARRRTYRERLGRLGPGNVDLAAYFVARALRWLRPGGRFGLVVPQGLCEARAAGALRALLAEHCVEALVSLEWAPPQFRGATVIPCLLVVRKERPAPSHRVALGRAHAKAKEGLEFEWTRLRQARWLSLGGERWPLSLPPGGLGWLETLRAAPTPLRAGYGLAVRTRARAGSLIAQAPAPPSFRTPRPLVDGREVRAWSVDYAGRVIDYRPELLSDPKSEAFFACPKVLVPRIALTVQAAVDEGEHGPLVARNTVMVLRAPGTPLDEAPHAVAALLNSLPVRLYAFYLLRAGVLAGSHRATFYARLLSALPVPPGFLADSALRADFARRGREAQRLARAGATAALAEHERALDAAAVAAFGLGPRVLARLRALAAREPLRTLLAPRPPGARTRRIAVVDYPAGARYR